MTHTNHRQGSIDSLRGDWVVMMMATRGINDHDYKAKLANFLQIGLRHNPVNGGNSRIGNVLTLGWEKYIDEVYRNAGTNAAHTLVFDRADKFAKFLKDIVRADLGLSVIVSGLHKDKDQICREAGIKRHTVEHSLGIWGKTELLPHPKILEVTTMCGHGLIPFNLVRRMARSVRNGNLSLDQAASELGKPCLCGIFNTKRAQTLIEEYNACITEK